MPGKSYIGVIALGDTFVEIMEVSSNPNGSIEAPQGTLALRSDSPGLYQNQDGGTVWLAVVGGPAFTGIVLASSGVLTNYATIALAMAAAVAGDQILLYPGAYLQVIDFTGKTSVRVVGIGAPQGIILFGSSAGVVRVTGAPGCGIRNMTVFAPSSGANPAIDLTGLLAGETFSIDSVGFVGQGGTGSFIGGAHAGTVGVLGCLHVSGAASAFIDTNGGSGVYILESLTLAAGTLTDVFKLDGTATIVGTSIVVNGSYACMDLFEVGGTATLELQVLTTDLPLAIVNGLHIVADGVTVNLDLVHLTSTTYDLLVDGGLVGTGTQISFNACELLYERVSAPDAWFAGLGTNVFTFIDLGIWNDPAFRVLSELSVGSAAAPSESSFGEGDSTVLGMLVYSNDGAATWVDNTDAARSRLGSTFSLFQGVAVGNAAYFGSNSTNSHMFTGLKVDAGGTAIALGAGSLVWEFWDGATWTAFHIMVTDARAPYVQHAQDAFAEATDPTQIRFDMPTLEASWATTAVNGSTGYWVRCRIATGPIGTVPVLQRIKLGTNRTEINADGLVEFFGDAEPSTFIPQVALRTASGLVGSAPGSVNISYSANIALNQSLNSFNNGAVDGFGLIFSVPARLDTSRALSLHVHWIPSVATSGDVELELVAARVRIGDTLNGTLPEVRTTTVTTVALATQDVLYETELVLDLSDYVGDDQVVIALLRDATGGNPDDTLSGNVEISSIELIGTNWR